MPNLRTDDTVLDRILREMAEALPSVQAATPLLALEQQAAGRPAPRDLRAALQRSNGGLLAEVKRGSPSKGPFAPDLGAATTARIFRDHGAVAISVLTSPYFFGSNLDLDAVATALNADEQSGGRKCPPLLRKEFHFDPYQVVEARALGADAYLLIAKVLDTAQLRALIAAGEALGMTPFVEVTDEAETFSALQAGATVIGINNRNLHTFREDLGTTERLRPLIPPEIPVVAASGVHTRDDLARMRRCNVNAVLIGEALCVADSPGLAIKELFDE